jgi:RHS repeat-associated protein
VRGGSTYKLVTDELGSVRGVVDVASGTVVQRRDYDAWGVATTDSNGAFQALGYAGGMTDHATGLVLFGARDYAPAIGRWTDKDPVGFAGGQANLYTYAGSDPVNSVDPSGLGRGSGGGSSAGSEPAAPGSGGCNWDVRAFLDPFNTLSRIIRIRTDVLNEAKARVLLGPRRDAWIHAEASHRIAIEYGSNVAINAGVMQEVLTELIGARNPPEDTEHDFMNNWQGANYGWGADELLRRGMLFESPEKRIPRPGR